MLFICYSGCSTCKKARAWLDEAGFEYTVRDVKEAPPTAEELDAWQTQSGLPMKKFFNTSGQSYRVPGMKERVASATREEQLALLAADGMLVKRPILVTDDKVLVGFRPAEWEAALR